MISNKVLFIIITALAGFVLGKKFPKLSPELITKSMILFFAPLLFFASILKWDLHLDYLKVFFISCSLHLSFIFFGIFINKKNIFLSKSEKAIANFSNTTANYGNIGIPICIAFIGEEAILPSLFMILSTHIFFNTFGAYFLARHNMSIKKSLLAILKLPTIWTLIAALCVKFSNIKIPDTILNEMYETGKVIFPLGLLSIGVFLSRVKNFFSNFNLVFYINFIKLFLFPLLAGVLVNLIDLETLNRNTILLQSTMPIAIMTVIWANFFDVEPNKAAIAVFWSTLTAIITIPLWAFFWGII